MTASTASTSLTAVELDRLARARELAGMDGPALRAHFGTGDAGEACAKGLGRAQVLLLELALIIERLAAG